jgi:teichuronic acid biosynthesis protein TuaE
MQTVFSSKLHYSLRFFYYLLIFGVGFSSFTLLDLHVFSLTLWRMAIFLLAINLFLVFLFKNLHIKNLGCFNSLLLIVLFINSMYIVFSAAWAPSLHDSLRYIFVFMIGTIPLYVSIFLYNSKRLLSGSFQTWAYSASFFVTITYVSYLLNHQFPSSRHYGLDDRPPTGFFFNENDFAIYLSISFLFILHHVFLSKRVSIKIFFYIILGILFYLLYLINSQGAIATLVIGFVLFVFFKYAKLKPFFAFSFISLIPLALILMIFLNPWAYNQFLTILSKASDSPRTELLFITFQAFEKTKFLGVGPGQIEAYVGDHGFMVPMNIHNWLGEMVGNFGIVGLISWLLILLILFIGVLHSYLRCSSHHSESECSVLLALIIAFPIWSSIISSMVGYPVFWTVLSLIILKISTTFESDISTYGEYSSLHFLR